MLAQGIYATTIDSRRRIVLPLDAFTSNRKRVYYPTQYLLLLTEDKRYILVEYHDLEFKKPILRRLFNSFIVAGYEQIIKLNHRNNTFSLRVHFPAVTEHSLKPQSRIWLYATAEGFFEVFWTKKMLNKRYPQCRGTIK